ncbi:MAG: VanZ family protein [Bacteroidetes bacterium]|nr:VanZ family protein [Bacteroidota bacterium]
MNNFWKYNWPSILWAVFILLLCLTPGSTLPSFNLFQVDKLAHLVVYAILAMLLYYGWKNQSAFPYLHRQVFVKILAGTFCYGLAIEYMQALFTVDRQYDFDDAIANSVGALVGSLLVIYVLPKLFPGRL